MIENNTTLNPQVIKKIYISGSGNIFRDGYKCLIYSKKASAWNFVGNSNTSVEQNVKITCMDSPVFFDSLQIK